MPAAEQAAPRAAAAARDLLRTQADALRAAAEGARTGDPVAIHAFRVAARRLRSTLTTYAEVLEPAPGSATASQTALGPASGSSRRLRDELRWCAGELGQVRDAEVMADRLLGRIAEERPELVVGPVVERVTTELGTAVARGAAQARRALGSSRYARLLGALDARLDALDVPGGGNPELTAASASSVARAALRSDLRRLRRAVRAADRTAPAGPERDAALHEIRKKAKRVRYAAEAAVPLLGRPARRLERRAQVVQAVLGEHQDSVVARRYLVSIADRARASRESGFTYGRLHASEEADAARLARRAARRCRRLLGAAKGL